MHQQSGGDRIQVIHRQEDEHGYDYYQICDKSSGSDTSSSSPPHHCLLPLVRQRHQQPHHHPHLSVDSRRHPRHGLRCRPFCHHYDLRQTAPPSPLPHVILLLLLMASPSFLSSGRLSAFIVMAEPAAAPAAAAAAAANSSSTGFGGPIPLRSSGSDSPLYSSGYPFIGERRLSSRTVTTKYGSLRGVTLTLPNRSLQPIEVFLGKEIVHARLRIKTLIACCNLNNEERAGRRVELTRSRR